MGGMLGWGENKLVTKVALFSKALYGQHGFFGGDVPPLHGGVLMEHFKLLFTRESWDGL